MEIAEVLKYFVTFDEKIFDGAVLITAIPIVGGSAKVRGAIKRAHQRGALFFLGILLCIKTFGRRGYPGGQVHQRASYAAMSVAIKSAAAYGLFTRRVSCR